MSGGGTLIKSGGGTLTLAADNSALSTVIQINGGTVKVSALNALGVTGVTIASGGAVNINGQSLATLPVTVEAPVPTAAAHWSILPRLNSMRWPT